MTPQSQGADDRAYGSLLGLAIGDALGMPTQGLSQQTVAARYGVLEQFVAGPADNPVSRGLPAGRVTDDTEQALILGRLLVQGDGDLDPYAFADALLGWQREMAGRGSLDLLGPSTLRALAALRSGAAVDEAGRGGDTNGAAMRIAPVGISTPLQPLPRLVDAVAAASRLTHFTGIAVSGAAAIAAAVSAGIEGLAPQAALDRAVAAARLGAAQGAYAAGARVADRIEVAMRHVTAAPGSTALLDVVDRVVGTSLATQESVPAALAFVAAFPNDPWEVCRHAASVGGDCDTIAAMAGAVAGALHGAAGFPSCVVEELLAANPDLDLGPLSRDLLAIRRRRSSAP